MRESKNAQAPKACITCAPLVLLVIREAKSKPSSACCLRWYEPTSYLSCVLAYDKFHSNSERERAVKRVQICQAFVND
uniref:Uncharacterized protein n=1 Tax=Caenorhabditis japonica TaxID=281687 RepID=A0A8R1E7Y7_CAEJA